MSEGAAEGMEAQNSNTHTKISNWRNEGHGAGKAKESKRAGAYQLICVEFNISSYLLRSILKGASPPSPLPRL